MSKYNYPQNKTNKNKLSLDNNINKKVLNLIAYNVHGLENKLFHPDFFKHLEQSDIFILIETHVEERNVVKFENRFRNFHTSWKSATRSSIYGRAMGGLVCGVKKDLIDIGLRHVLKICDNISLLQVTSSDFKFTIVPVYLRGANWNQDFEELKRCLQETYVVNPIIMGDLNVRLGEEQQNINENIMVDFPAGLENRQSADKIVNARGRRLIELCNEQGLVILNGRTTGDADGRYTFISNVGNSVNDICAVSIHNLERVVSFEVTDQIWSDHLPIELKISANNSGNTMKRMELLPKLKWNPHRAEAYRNKLEHNLNFLKERKTDILLEDLTDVILKSHENSRYNVNGKKFKSKWFDRECNEAREKSMRSLRLHQKKRTVEDKDAYLRYKCEYQNLCRQKRNNYWEQVEHKLDTVNDSKTWWALAREIRQQESQIGTKVTAEAFHDYFRELLNPSVRADDIWYAANLIEDAQLDDPFTVHEVKIQLTRTKPNKAPGEDRIPYEFYVNATDEYLGELAKVFTKMLNGANSFEALQKSIIFPIHKKGDVNLPENYRGISFLNCMGKIMMGMINERISNWSNSNQVLNEFQAGFRKGYSTVDNIHNLTAITNYKFAEGRKVYAFFVDFKAAFDRVPRNLLIYKLHQLGMSTKVLNFIESVYQNTTSSVWTGAELSETFETKSGVKQGCLLSPLLFALYLNDLHEHLNGGLFIEDMNIRVLMYADDIVMLADDVNTLQMMSNNLEHYCKKWGMQVNLSKSEILIFRKGGRVSCKEKWTYNGEPVKVTSEYKYLGITLTPKMSFTKHVISKNNAAKLSLNATWKNFIGKNQISLRAKWKMFLAVSRSIQSYGAQVWGNGHFDEVDKLQRYFTKRILRLPDNTPNYVVALETAQEETHFYTYSLHLKYISKTIFDYENHRLPHKLTKIVMAKNIGWYKDFCTILRENNLSAHNIMESKQMWNTVCMTLLDRMSAKCKEDHIRNSQRSQERIYKNLDFTVSLSYCNENYNQEKISYIMRARADKLWLNGNSFGDENSRICSLCNLRERENTRHFVGRCPALKEIRQQFLKCAYLSDYELHNVLNGGENADWMALYNYVKSALKYRNFLVAEFNY